MYVREIKSPRLAVANSRADKPKKKRRFGNLVLILLIMFGLFFLGHSHASDKGSVITSGYKGYCLDNYRDQNVSGNKVDIWSCNSKAAQSWSVSLTQIKKPDNLCLSANNVSSVSLGTCNKSSNQIWLEDGNELYNPHYGLCLSAANPKNGISLSLQACNQSSTASQVFLPTINLLDTPCTGSQGDIVACNTVKEWIRWQAKPNQREAYITNYTDGAPYEEWCADFVSYIYKESGFAFTNGNSSGWDENIADQIQSQGFNVHQPGSYVPKPGDVAYFDYGGGHVEIVIAGGNTPTFIYGDSATIDPIINNGAMEANDITSESSLGSLQYYLSPSSNT